MRAIGDIELKDLLLDAENPRLPDNLSDRTQESILDHLLRRAALQELAESMFFNGFFSSEPVMVSKAQADGKRIVLEGNRRLATALILSGDERAAARDLRFRIDGAPVEKKISHLPCIEVDNENEFDTYLGFRHISGLRMWGASEKARYLWSRVRGYSGEGDPFYKVGRQVGSNARGVRSAYVAYEILQFARREGTDAELLEYVAGERFGVWTRLLGTRNLATFIRFEQGVSNLADVDQSIQRIDTSKLAQVLSDLRPRTGRAEPVLRDSRQVTDYSDVLGDSTAWNVLRSSGNLDLATTIANRPDVDGQLQALIDRVEVLQNSVSEGAGLTDESSSLASRLAKSAKVLQVTILTFAEESE